MANTPPSEENGTHFDPADIGLILLGLYVVLLAVGTVAELFDIRWILNLPIY